MWLVMMLHFFSDVVIENVVMVLNARHLNRLFDSYENILLKIDVEGYEDQLLLALDDVTQRLSTT
jgi:hypothetical protein